MIGLIDVDGKLPNLALMKLSTYYKSLGHKVEFVDFNNLNKYSKIYASCLFTWNRIECLKLIKLIGDRLVLGGTGWDFQEINGILIQTTKTVLPPEIEIMKPDYDLYSRDMIYKNICGGISKKETLIIKAETIANMGMGFINRGCSRSCGFCVVKSKEGNIKRVGNLSDIINPRSNVVTIFDNNITADPNCLDILHEIKNRKLIVDISQGIDVRILTDEVAHAVGKIRHLRSINYAWDLMKYESEVLNGINLLSKYAKVYRHKCFVLVGYNTDFEEDKYRVLKLISMNIDPYVMIYNKNHHNDIRLKHFARWVNGHVYTVSDFNNYKPWIKAQKEENQIKLAI